MKKPIRRKILKPPDKGSITLAQARKAARLIKTSKTSTVAKASS
jgi:hypothetical protein